MSVPGARTALVLLAAGDGRRLGYGIPKAAVSLDGESILLRAFRQVFNIAHRWSAPVVVALPSEGGKGAAPLEAQCRQLLHHHPASVASCVFRSGGASRMESVRRCLEEVPAGYDHVLIHDAARPLAPLEVFERVSCALWEGAEAVVPALEVHDTIKISERGAGAILERISSTVDRRPLRRVQTPQGFRLSTLLAAHRQAEGWSAERRESVTDDAMILETLGVPIHLVMGSELAYKITTPLDMVIAQALANHAARGRRDISPQTQE